MKNQHGPQDKKTFYKGASPDLDKEFLGAQQSNGEYINARNMRPTSVVGQTFSMTKIGGETIFYQAASGLTANHICIGKTVVSGRKIELWASPIPGDLDSIRIDGDVMVQSDGLLFDTAHPFQIAKNESCDEGEFFVTDDFTVPMIFDVNDIITEFNAGNPTYFANFNRSLYEINLSAPLDIPVFIELVNLGGGAGLPTGEYSYSIRYVNNAGDRTNFGPTTPLIPVLQGTGVDSPEYPYTKTFGGEANVASNTSFGIKLRFRVTNLLNYDSIEIRRYSWNTGVLNVTPQPEIVARLAIADGEISVREWTDPSDSNVLEVITDADDVDQLSYIEKAKAIRYYDKKLVLMNYVLADRRMNATFLQRNGVEMFPMVWRMGTAGHSDPYNHVYKKGYMGGEEYGFAVQGFDGVAGRGFALGVPNFNSFRFPNRREEVVSGSDNETYSYNGVVTAANINNVVTGTYEAFDLVNGVKKSDNCTFKNIMDDGGKFEGDINQDCTVNYANFGATKNAGGIVEAPYGPYRPVNQNDSITSGHSYQVNTKVGAQTSAGVITTELDYNPEGFAPNYYSKGIMLNGISNLPPWVKAFSVTRTKRAGRVVAQGIGMYSLNQADFNLIGNSSTGNKDISRLWFFSPDTSTSGFVSQGVIDDIRVNPQNYSIQFVSPLGYFSELYNFERNIGSGRDLINDLIVYVRALKDSGELNNSESGVGVSDYVTYNKYRNSDTAGAGFFSASDGNKLMPINTFTNKTDGRQSYFEIGLSTNIYQHQFTGGTGNNDFFDSGMRDFAEPIYMINIVQDGAKVVDQNIDTYLDTGAYVKLESIIGEGDGVTVDPSFVLVDERWEDCIPALVLTSPLAGQERFVWVDDGIGNINAWYNVTYLTPAQVAVVVNDITTNGFHTTPGGQNVFGVFTHNISADQRTFTIEFDIPGFNVLPTGHRVLVRYNNDAPISVFGGDVTVAESVFAPIDRQATGEDTSTQRDKQFALDIGMPYRHYHVTPRHYIVRDATSTTNKIQDSKSGSTRIHGRLAYIRQMVVNFIAETRLAVHYAFGGPGVDERFFPSTHYIIRPNKFDDSSFSSGATTVYNDNNVYAAYEDDYGDEYLRWTYGGFKFLPLHNPDYAQENLEEFFSKPDIGFTANNDYCTGVIWSLSRAVNQQDSPGLKTFLSSNSFIISDDQGEIKRAWDATTNKGDNLYAFCDRGTCLLLTKKSILSGADGTNLATSFSDQFVGGEYWLDKKIGMNDEMWRSAAETSAPLATESGIESSVETIFWANDRSAYRMYNNNIQDIGKTGFYSELRDPLSKIQPGYTNLVAGYYDEKYEEYGLQIEYVVPGVGGPASAFDKLFVFSQRNSKFIGEYDYRYDNYSYDKDALFGMRDGETYELDNGNQINGANIIAHVDQASAPEFGAEKEYMFINVNSNLKPTKIEFFDVDRTLLCTMDQATQGTLYLKEYRGFRQHIPRKDLTVSATRDRIQDRVVLYRITHDTPGAFSIKGCDIHYKLIV